MSRRRMLIICSLTAILALACMTASYAQCCGSTPAASTKPTATAGCGASSTGCAIAPGTTSSSCGCGSSASTQPTAAKSAPAPAPQKAADLDKANSAKLETLQAKFNKKRDEVSKLIADPKASNASISKAMHELAGIQADMQLVKIFAQRSRGTATATAQVTTPAGSSCSGASKSTLSTIGMTTPAAGKPAGSCGCGTSSGGCGAPASTKTATVKATPAAVKPAGSTCGCGSASGGCGTSAPKAPTATQPAKLSK